MRNVVQVAPEGKSYSVIDLDNMRTAQLQATMRESGRNEVYEAHVKVFVDLFEAEAKMATIEPYWAGIVGEQGKRDAVQHLRNEAKQRITLKAQIAAVEAAKRGK